MTTFGKPHQPSALCLLSIYKPDVLIFGSLYFLGILLNLVGFIKFEVYY